MTAMAIDRVRANLFVAAITIDRYMSESTGYIMPADCLVCVVECHTSIATYHLESTLHYVEVRGREAVGEHVLRV